MKETEERRVAVLGIIIEDDHSVEAFNALAHSYRHIILGRMGIPHRVRRINIVSLAVDGTQSEINALSGKIGRLRGVHVKTAYASPVEQSKPLTSTSDGNSCNLSRKEREDVRSKIDESH